MLPYFHAQDQAISRRFARKKRSLSNEEIFHVSGFTRPYLPVTLNKDQDSVVPARWKFIPFWVKTEDDAAKYEKTLNAESEPNFEKASYKHSILKTRGLPYVNGFYEPHNSLGKKKLRTITYTLQQKKYLP